MLIQNHQTMIRVILIVLTILIVLGGILFFVCLKKKVDAEVEGGKGGKVGAWQKDEYVNIDEVIGNEGIVRGPKAKVMDSGKNGSGEKMAKDTMETKDTIGTTGGLQNKLSEF